MPKRQETTRYLLMIPIRVEVHSLADGEVLSHNETEVKDVLFSTFVDELEQELQTPNRELHTDQKNRIVAYVRRELLPKEAPDSPIHLPNTYIEVIVSGDISTWKKQPYNKHLNELQ